MKLHYYTGISFKDRIYLFYLRKLSNHPGEKKLRRFITNHCFTKGIGVISNLHAKFKIKTFDYIDQELIFKGSYEPLTVELCNSLVDSDDIFIDVGSNFGLYAVNIACCKNCRVIAIEPNPVTFNRLLENKKFNKLDNLLLLNIAVGEKHEISGMICPSMNNAGNYQISDKNSEFFISVVPLQKVFDTFNIVRIKLLKIDIEGYELLAFKGIDWDKVEIENIIMEYIPGHISFHKISDIEPIYFLLNLGYEPYRINGGKYNFKGSLPESNIWLKKTH